ncbi:hypothetical protein L226DRAFT_177194 [Lentinus tigrinus ALCF2SS1-7]|uniref:uncharacterized protein n=1 Tax=Lentinus tigrinus ALCF2SS1-7 TaxID=1328758 RepID=UPI001166058D|nr:hypothetical protein L226DRAFT_177194 [Lentinus tigrinus ALCF2SS1-7]
MRYSARPAVHPSMRACPRPADRGRTGTTVLCKSAIPSQGAIGGLRHVGRAGEPDVGDCRLPPRCHFASMEHLASRWVGVVHS